MKSTARLLTLLSILLVVLVLLNALPFIEKRWPVVITGQNISSPVTTTASPLLPSPTIGLLPDTITVSGTPWGKSTCFIGATEGSSRFSIADLKDHAGTFR